MHKVNEKITIIKMFKIIEIKRYARELCCVAEGNGLHKVNTDFNDDDEKIQIIKMFKII